MKMVTWINVMSLTDTSDSSCCQLGSWWCRTESCSQHLWSQEDWYCLQHRAYLTTLTHRTPEDRFMLVGVEWYIKKGHASSTSFWEASKTCEWNTCIASSRSTSRSVAFSMSYGYNHCNHHLGLSHVNKCCKQYGMLFWSQKNHPQSIICMVVWRTQ